MASVINQINIDNTNYAIAASAYAECSTAAATVAKVASIITDDDTTNVDFTLIKGVSVKVKFTYSNTASSPTLNINGTGAKAIKRYGTTAVGTSASASWRAGAIVELTYDGTNWVMTTSIDDNSGDITKVTAGNGLTGGGSSGSVTLNVGAGSGITVEADTVSHADTSTLEGSYGPTADVTQSAKSNASIVVPQITVDGFGHVTGVTNWTLTVTDTNTDNNTSHGHTAGVGLVGSGSAGTGSGTYDYKVALVNETKASNASSYTAGGSSKFYAVQVDSNGKLAVNVPWTDTNSTNFASPTHTHNYSGTTAASDSEVAVVTGVGANGTATVLTGVTVSNSSPAAPANHTHAYNQTTGITLTANTSNATGRIAYVSSIDYTEASALGTAKAGSEGHTHTYSKASLSGSNSSHTTKYMKFSAGTTPKSSATPNHTSTASSSNSGTAVTAVTGVGANGTATALTGVKVSNSSSAAPGGHTHSFTPTGTIELAASEIGDLGYLQYVHDIAGGTYTLGGTKTFVKSVSGGSGSLVSYTTSSGSTVQVSNGTRVPYIAGTLSGSTLTLNTYYLAHTHSPASGSTGTVSLSGTSPYAIYRYIEPTFTGTSSTSGANSGTNFNAATAVSSNGTATVLTGVKATGTADVAPSGHTHNYDKTTSVSLTAGTAPSMNFNTGSSSDTPYVASMTNSSISLSHSTVNTGAPSATTSFVTGVSGGSITPSTKYLSAAPSNSSSNTASNSGTNFNAATEVAATGTATVLKGVKATGTVSVPSGNHTHTYSGATGTPQ